MKRTTTLIWTVFAAVCTVPFVLTTACSSTNGDASRAPSAGPEDAGRNDTDGTATVDGAAGTGGDAGAPDALPGCKTTQAAPVTTALLQAQIAGTPFSSKSALARPSPSAAGYLEVLITDVASTCASPAEGSRGIRMVVPAGAFPTLGSAPPLKCDVADPVSVNFFYNAPPDAGPGVQPTYVNSVPSGRLDFAMVPSPVSSSGPTTIEVGMDLSFGGDFAVGQKSVLPCQ